MTQSARKALTSFARFLVLCAAVTALSACGMSSLTSGIGGGWFGNKKSASNDVGSVSEADLLAAAKSDTGVLATSGGGEVAHGCPRVNVWSRDGYVTIFEQGKVGDALSVMHRGEITKTARECNIEPGRVTVRYGFSGRVLLGQKGKTGRVSLPVNVFVADAKRERIANEKVRVDVDVAVDNPIGYFSIVRSVTFNIPEGTRPGEYEVFVGFDRTAPGAG